MPDRPGAWLTTTARNRALDKLRRSKNEAAKLKEVAMLAEPAEPADPDGSGVTDDRLRLIFTCCHPALSLRAAQGVLHLADKHQPGRLEAACAKAAAAVTRPTGSSRASSPPAPSRSP